MVLEGRPRRGIVLDVSATGLFVQTASQPRPGTVLDLRLLEGGDRPEMALRVRVARQRKVEPRLAQIQANGVGLHILEAPPAYYEYVAEGERPASGGAPGGSGTPRRSGALPGSARSARSARSKRSAGTAPGTSDSSGDGGAHAGAAEALGDTYKVRVSQVEGTRSRTVTVEAASEDAARGAALERVGEGWEVVEVRAA